MPVLDERERRALTSADQELGAWQEALEAAVRQGALDSAHVERLRDMAREVASRVNRELPIHIDPAAASEIRSRLVELLTIRPDEGQRPLDVADRVLMESEAIRHILRDTLENALPIQRQSASELIAQVEEWLPSLTVKQHAELLGLSERSLQRRRGGEGQSTDRMVVVAQLAAMLRHAWTDEGVYEWFRRPRRDLGDVAPFDMLDDAAAQQSLLRAARAGRVQGAA